MNYALSEDAIKFLCSNGGKVDFDEFTGGETPPPIPIECGGTNANNSEEALLNLGGLSMKLLWQNASPTSAFAAQTISLDLSGDSKIIIEFNSDSSSGVKDIQTIINPVVVGKGGVGIRFGGVQDNYLGSIHFRYYQVTNNSITFNNSYYQSWTGTTATLNNNFVIPYRVYVIKGVQ